MAPSGENAFLDELDGVPSGGCDDIDAGIPIFEDLTPFEVEHFVQDLEEFKLEDVGSSRWLTHHERIEKLNWTAHNQAKDGLDEFVVDQFNTMEKVPTLIYDLMLIEVWKEKIWPLVKAKISKFSSLRTYIPVYHEASVANLLEICLYHRTTCEEAGDALVDLVDWSVRKVRYLLSRSNEELVRQVANVKECADWDNVRCLDEQFYECEFQVSMCAIAIIRFLTDHRVAVPLAVTVRLLEAHDVLQLLVPLMEKAPWVRKNRVNGRIEKFDAHRWEPVEADDEGRLPKLHCQVWLAIYNLVMDQECRSRYELTSFRKENLLRLRRYINEVVVDQLPPLTNLHRTLEEMAISGGFTGAGNAPAPSPFVVELVAEAREMLVRTYEGRWQEVADIQLRDVLVKETPDELKRLGEMISIPRELLGEEVPAQAEAEGSDNSAASRAQASWDAVMDLTVLRSTASFFAAARESPPDEVLVLKALPQDAPGPGDVLRLELRRARQGQLGTGAGAANGALGRVAADVKKTQADSEGFSLAIDGPGILPTAVRSLPFVSTKGAAKSALQLRELLQKPGRENLLAMYSDDVVEFSVPVGSVPDSQADGGTKSLSHHHIVGLASAFRG